jgi:hypothetical protein
VDSRTTDKLSLRQVERVVDKMMYQFFSKGVCEWGFAILSELALHIPENFPVSKSWEPHMVHTRYEGDVSISCL